MAYGQQVAARVFRRHPRRRGRTKGLKAEVLTAEGLTAEGEGSQGERLQVRAAGGCLCCAGGALQERKQG